MNASVLTVLLVLLDYLFSAGAWAVFYMLRKSQIEETTFSSDPNFLLGVFLVPLIWMFIYLLQGTYHDVRRLFRLRILNLTLGATLIGVLVVFFLFLLDDQITGYKQYYKSILLLTAVLFTFLMIPRFLFVSYIVHKIHSRQAGFRTLLVGGSDKAVEIFNEIQSSPKGYGTDFVGFINLNGVDTLLKDKLPYFGHFDDVDGILRKYEIEEVIIALESTEHDRLRKVISRLEGSQLKIKILPDMYDILSGTVEMSNIFGALLIDINSEVMPVWQRVFKRLLDFIVSTLALIFLIPLFLVLAIVIKLTSPGPIFFLQERIGMNGKPFQIIKFRTMVPNAEKAGPQLSSSNDPRITKIGRFMRKYRIDEFPQFINVILGHMSLVGPRPERQYYIDKIAELEPQFHQLTNVRPGITSWGQVKFGYAENVDEMLARMKFDLLYLKNRSLALDLKIMLYTVMIVFKGAGK
jgi:exopolysaccharide biosynthesis polyprenyl glycosylphosphotransferase